MALEMKTPRRARLINTGELGPDWLCRNFVFELATSGLKSCFNAERLNLTLKNTLETIHRDTFELQNRNARKVS
jgi:hypothetical protein